MRQRLYLFALIFTTTITIGCSGDKTTASATQEAESEATDVDRSHPDYENLLGSWRIVESEWDGDPNERAVGNFFTFSNTRLKAWIRGMGDISLDYEIDPTTTPKHLTARMGRPRTKVFTRQSMSWMETT